MVNRLWVIAVCTVASFLWLVRVLRGLQKRAVGFYFVGLGTVFAGSSALATFLFSSGQTFIESLNWRLSGIMGMGFGLILAGLFQLFAKSRS